MLPQLGGRILRGKFVLQLIHWNVFVLEYAETEWTGFFVVEIDLEMVRLDLVSLIVFSDCFQFIYAVKCYIFISLKYVRLSGLINPIAKPYGSTFHIFFAN